ncbi:MAG: hypothetical protein ABIT38_19250 [Gemmatimonadaceae bacterium]
MTMSLSSISSTRRRAVAVSAVLVGAAFFASCNDPLALKATVEVRTDTLSAFAMTGTPVTYPSAFDAQNSAVVRISTDIAFDVAFDFTSTGAVQLLPARQVSSSANTGGVIVTSSRRVGLQKGSGTFESITKAPNKNYTYDSLMVVNTGVPVVMELTSANCQFSLSSTIYAKIVIDSINAGTRRLFFRSTVDPNCGFRSFQPGVPKS